MVDVIAEFKHFSEFVIFRVLNFTHVALAEQIAVSSVGLGILLVLISLILFLV
ncbi:hypothetical protein HY495_03170 [Candidatus Woesearchaeota archaeon]|nr:hypothetical protein [Candidatus Woesearchaeota archaeon]